MMGATAPKGLESSENAVVHLVLRNYGRDEFARFVSSYRRFPPGMHCELVLGIKQFASLAEFGPWLQLLDGIPHRILFLADRGLDIGSYFEVAYRTRYRRYFFCNSRTQFVCANWLALMTAALVSHRADVAGASGSWQSVSSEHYRNLMRYSRWPHPFRAARACRGFLPLWHNYPRFPNPHLRTNAFLIDRETFLALDVPEIGGKHDAMVFESGRRSLTRQVLGRKGKVILVDRDGRGHEPVQWRDSGTFWSAGQANLLVADNQTRKFADGPADVSAELSYTAWRL